MPFRNPIVAGEKLVRTEIHSANYVQGVTGWRIAEDGGTQFQTASVIGDLGADNISADSLTLDGQDVADTLAAIPTGLKTYSSFPNAGTTADTDSIGGTETIVMEFAFPDVFADHYYMFVWGCHIVKTVDTDRFRIRFRYTTNGTTPTLSSSIMDHSSHDLLADSSRSWFYSPASNDYDLVRVAVTLQRLAGTGTAVMNTTDPNYGSYLAIVDLGLDSNVVMDTGSQLSVSGGSPEPAKTTTYKRTFRATWSRSYDGDGSTRSPDTEDCYQGYYGSIHGRQRSLVGFDYAAIQSALSGATVLSVKLTFKVKYRAWSDGLDVVVSVHDYTSKPGTWSGARVDENEASRNNCNQGSTYTVDLSAHGNDFKTGGVTGVGFGPGASNAHAIYGRIHGVDAGTSRPYLTITYRK